MEFPGLSGGSHKVSLSRDSGSFGVRWLATALGAAGLPAQGGTSGVSLLQRLRLAAASRRGEKLRQAAALHMQIMRM